ncbi:PH domain-containing protein [Secundilactobacillus silagei]|nr:PH domain-containing protein [Secundilactobacillus silagei]
MMESGQALPAKIKTVWRISAGCSFLVGLLITGGLLTATVIWQWSRLFWLISAGLTVAEVVIELALIPYRYRFWRYRISERDVEIESGFFFHQQTAIPINRIQNVTLEAGPILQWQKLQTVSIETAATSHKIESVLPETAQQLKQQIMALALEAKPDDR